MTRDEFYSEILQPGEKITIDRLMEITDRLARAEAADVMYNDHTPEMITLDGIFTTVCTWFKFSPEAVKGDSRRGWLIYARHIFYRLAHEQGYEPPAIAAFVGHTRSAVIHGIHQAKNRPELVKKYSEMIGYVKYVL
jgi:chromosomal replication initiation ATPase DnaA